MLLNEVISRVARDLTTDLAHGRHLTVEVFPRTHRDGTLWYDAVATYTLSGQVTDWSLTGRHPMTGDERWWHDVFATRADELGPSAAARAATLTVFGVDPGAVTQ